MTDLPAGRFITLEGGEGAGKSTQIARLKDKLERLGHAVVATREPGGAPGAEMVRKLLVEGPAERWDGTTEALLHFAARRDHLRSTVWPALKRGAWVISDRFADSTVAYQGYGYGVDRLMLDKLYGIAVGDFRRVRAGFLEIATADPGRCVVIDATRDIEAVAAAIAAAVRVRLGA